VFGPQTADIRAGAVDKSIRRANLNSQALVVRKTSTMSDPQVILVADVHGLLGSRAELHALLRGLADGAHTEADCVSFRVLAGEDPADFVLLGAWTSENALLEHYRTPHYRHYRTQVGLLLARPSDVLVHHLSATVHPQDPEIPPDPGEVG
jgi:quinol monooxygenase YgiN